MKILLANKYYYPRGGDCIYTIGLENLLKKKGHEVAIFSMQHPLNLDSVFSDYFPAEVDFSRKRLKNLFTSIMRPFGSREVKRHFKRLINDFEPDIVHLNNIHSQLSPVIAEIAHKQNIPVVWTLHDSKLVCPAYLLLSHGKICEACFDNKINVIKKRCIKNSYMASFLAYLEAIYWNKKRIIKATDRFISPSVFLKNKIICGGYPDSKIEVINNFIDPLRTDVQNQERKNHYCYIGRLSAEKGIETLLRAALELPGYPVKIIGTGPLEEFLKAKYKSDHIEFSGYQEWDGLKNILSGSRFMVIPSECYENNPLTIVESLCLGTPVIGSNIGGIPEMITPGINGLLFEPCNITDLQDKISHLWQHQGNFNNSEIARDARLKYDSDIYYEKIMRIYSSLSV